MVPEGIMNWITWKTYIGFIGVGFILNTVVYFADQDQINKDVSDFVAFSRDLLQSDDSILCTPQAGCGQHGDCVPSRIYPNTTVCDCDEGFTNHDGVCNYRQLSQVIAFVLAIIPCTGCLGTNWFYLARGNGCYICLGIFKLITIGGCGFWILIDWILILASVVTDGNGVDLKTFT